MMAKRGDTPGANDANAGWQLSFPADHLQNAILIRARYTLFSDRWDHDHCEFCWAKFSMREGDLHEGYCTPDRYRWICDTCYEEFKEQFHFTVAP